MMLIKSFVHLNHRTYRFSCAILNHNEKNTATQISPQSFSSSYPTSPKNFCEMATLNHVHLVLFHPYKKKNKE